MKASEQTNDAKIYDQGYRPFQGRLLSPGTRFWSIALSELRQAWKGKWFRRLLWVSFIPLVVFCVLVIVSSRFPSVASEMGGIWPKFWGVQLFMAMFMVYFVGRGAVGEDLRTGALSVYFSRPVSFTQYLTGKWLAISVGVLGVTLVPGLVLGLFKWLAEPGSGVVNFLSWVGILVLLAILLCGALGAVMLAISSLTRRSRAAGIVWLAMFFVLSGIAEALTDTTGLSQFEVISYFSANTRLAELLFEGTGSMSEVLWFGLGQVAWMVVAFVVVLIRLKRWVRM